MALKQPDRAREKSRQIVITQQKQKQRPGLELGPLQKQTPDWMHKKQFGLNADLSQLLIKLTHNYQKDASDKEQVLTIEKPKVYQVLNQSATKNVELHPYTEPRPLTLMQVKQLVLPKR